MICHSEEATGTHVSTVADFLTSSADLITEDSRCSGHVPAAAGARPPSSTPRHPAARGLPEGSFPPRSLPHFRLTMNEYPTRM